MQMGGAKRRLSKLAHLQHMLCLHVDANIQVEHDRLCSTAPVLNMIVMIAHAFATIVANNDCMMLFQSAAL